MRERRGREGVCDAVPQPPMEGRKRQIDTNVPSLHRSNHQNQPALRPSLIGRISHCSRTAATTTPPPKKARTPHTFPRYTYILVQKYWHFCKFPCGPRVLSLISGNSSSFLKEKGKRISPSNPQSLCTHAPAAELKGQVKAASPPPKKKDSPFSQGVKSTKNRSFFGGGREGDVAVRPRTRVLKRDGGLWTVRVAPVLPMNFDIINSFRGGIHLALPITNLI